jgi:hypothetical protein
MMMFLVTLLVAVVLAENGIVELDQVSFDKIVGGAHGVLVSLSLLCQKCQNDFLVVDCAFVLFCTAFLGIFCYILSRSLKNNWFTCSGVGWLALL